MKLKIAIAIAIVIAVAVLALAAAAGYLVGSDRPAGPDCPTEDSCTIDYRDGGWHIEPTVP